MSRHSLDKSKPTFTAFPSPSTPKEVGPWPSSTSGDSSGDAFPFPLNPISLKSGDSKETLPHCAGRSPKRKYISTSPAYVTPPTSPDRFIPARRSPESSSKSFHLSKPPYKLPSPERLNRQHSSSPDPFSLHNPRRDVRRVATEVGTRTPPQAGLQTRNVSAGAIWNVGGNATVDPGPVTAVPNGRGGLFGSGTNAPMFSSRFLEPETEDQIVERFEGRLAAALDIDRTSRTLNISHSPQRGRSTNSSPSTFASQRSPMASRTVWQDGRWMNEGDKEPKALKAKYRRPVPSTPFRYVCNHLSS